MMLDLPFPAKILWPNGRGHHMARHREAKKHKAWAHTAALAARSMAPAGENLRLIATFYPKTSHAIDKDNASASLKAYQDGIALALGVDDKHFAEPSIQFGPPEKPGKVIIVVEAV